MLPPEGPSSTPCRAAHGIGMVCVAVSPGSQGPLQGVAQSQSAPCPDAQWAPRKLSKQMRELISGRGNEGCGWPRRMES